jgi:hypothetical protein
LGFELPDISLFPALHLSTPKSFSVTNLLAQAGLGAVCGPLGPIIGSGVGGYINRQLGDPHFSFRKLRDGGKHAVIFVNGFLSQGNRETADWEGALKRKFGRATWYHLDWDACGHPHDAYVGERPR